MSLFGIGAALVFVSAAGASPPPKSPAEKGMVLLPAGTYPSFYKVKPKSPAGGAVDKTVEPVAVAAFWLDSRPVTNREFRDFVRSVPEWRKSKIKPLFTDGHYLERWRSDLDFAPTGRPDGPVVQVSWYAAEAYCEWKGKSLPTVDQWEYAANDDGRNAEERKRFILEWYGKPNPKTLPAVGRTPKNGFGIYDLQGLVWEWTEDFNGFVQGDESREKGAVDGKFFCGGGSVNAADATDYAAFMRFSFRNSLKGNYAVANLGFRCAKEVVHGP
ncbi:MAG: formylglycine-generating enzyme family protein [Bdellovibrionales bacterium]|nr:formylglycine-generating enzyme family protein [Bdellovibrionales bacterium]